MNNELINDAANVLAQFSVELAEAFRSQPFRRVDLARAFARGFVRDSGEDIHPTAEVILRVALLDREMRAAA